MRRRNQPILTALRWIFGTLFVLFFLMCFGVSEGNPVSNQVVPSPGSTPPASAVEDGTTVTMPIVGSTDVLQTP